MYKFDDWRRFECELVSASEQVDRKTEKYLYTTEMVEYLRYRYQVNWKPDKFHRFSRSWSCTVYATEEEAERGAKINAEGRDWFITKECDHTFQTISHRYKRK